MNYTQHLEAQVKALKAALEEVRVLIAQHTSDNTRAWSMAYDALRNQEAAEALAWLHLEAGGWADDEAETQQSNQATPKPLFELRKVAGWWVLYDDAGKPLTFEFAIQPTTDDTRDAIFYSQNLIERTKFPAGEYSLVIVNGE